MNGGEVKLIMDVQTKFTILHNQIIGIRSGSRTLTRFTKPLEKKCKWCGRPYKPTHNRQTYCNEACKHYSELERINNHMRRKRIKQRNGYLVNDRAILNVGTGGLGKHRDPDFSEEHRKIMCELHRCGLR